MGSILALLIIILVSFLVVRVGTNALVLTGLSYKVARFQSISAFFGVGFTTAEAELVMGSVVRRKIIRHLIISGNIGLTSALATLVVTFTKAENGDGLNEFVILGVAILGIIALGLFFNLKLITKPMDAIMKKALQSSGVVRALDYDLLLKLEEGYCVSEVLIESGHPWAGLALHQSRPSDAEVVILNIQHADGEFTGAPNKDHVVFAGDEVMVYGSTAAVNRVAHLHIKDWSEQDAVEEIEDTGE